MSSRKSKIITYNIKERGRTHAGKDRSNVNIRSMVDAINSPATQELVDTGDMYGYYGHELRALYGMNPPDTVMTDDGREIRIAPAIRTIKLTANSNGDITHQQEFLENEAGEYAYQQYKAGIGGFSSACGFKPMMDGTRVVQGFYGYDYVRNPNYHTNKGAGLLDGLMFDGLSDDQLDPAMAQVKMVLHDSLVAQYDSIYEAIQAKGMVDYYQKEAIAAQNSFFDYVERQERIAKRREEKEIAMIDSLICPSVPLAELEKQYAAFDSVKIDAMRAATDDESQEKVARQDTERKESVRKLFRGRLW